MKKVLILSYFFPPGNFAGSYRVYAWAKHLHNSGYFPVVVTRKYDWAINNFADLSKPTSKGIIHEINDHFEVYYLPYHGNLKDKVLNNFGNNKLILFRKFLSFFELVFQNISIRVIPYKNLYSFSKSLLAKNPDFDLIISSGKPFILFKFCNMLNRRFKIPWIADYRDPWSTHPWFVNRGLLSTLDMHFEKKWVSTASAVTSCSALWAEQIGQYVGVNGFAVLNGYEPDTKVLINDGLAQKKEFIIVHNGTLYEDQQIELFALAFKKFIKSGFSPNCKLYFIGVNIDKYQVIRIRNLFKDYLQYIELTDRLPKSDVVKIMNKSSLLLLFGQENIKGWYPIKVFDYLIAKKKILLCPSDNDVLEQLIKDTNSGFTANSADEVFRVISESYKNWNEGIDIVVNNNNNEVQKYSREYQTKKLATVFDKVTEEKLINSKVIQPFSKRNFIFKLIYNSGINKLLY
jgi:glycosyltransferase involved in cell wall biosynthesis